MQVLGHYTKVPEAIGFYQYSAPCFPHRNPQHLSSCGENAFYMLTGEVFTFEQRLKFRNVLSQRAMLKLLKEKEYTVIPLSVCKVSNGPRMFNSVRDANVVLNCQIFARGEASWSICHNNAYFHEFWATPKVLEFINRPIIASWVIYHPSWKEEPTKPPAVKRKKK